jgi:serine/threonine protein kinase
VIGQTISHYRIVAKLGSGGMGVVYEAEDLKLGRRLALKFLPEELAGNPQALERLQREARAASSLNHPHICTIYDIENVDGRSFIAMELLQGHTLQHLLLKGRLKSQQALELAIQIADALEAANRRGIVHRDIKPANIFVDERWQVKLLDFGLAKSTQTTPVVEEQTELQQPTIDVQLTSPGSTLGTVAYMSPEQALGEELDARTDLFSCGVVLHEMLTGRPAFPGRTSAAVFDAIIHKAPTPVTGLQPGLPAEVDRVIGKLLEKDRDLRYQSAAELRADLKRLKRDTTSDSGVRHDSAENPAIADRHSRRVWPIAVMVGFILIAAVGWLLHAIGGSSKPGAALRMVPFTSSAGDKRTPAFSPDGRQLTFSWDDEKNDGARIYVQLVGAGTPLRLTSGPGDDDSPAWSPDGRFVAFMRHSKSVTGYFTVPALGGPEHKIADAYTDVAYGSLLDWSLDGKTLVVTDRMSPNDPRPSIILISLDNGQRRVVLSAKGPYLANATYSPDGKSIAFIEGAGFLSQELFVLRLATGETRPLTSDKAVIAGLAWTSDSKSIVFSSNRTGLQSLWRVPLEGGVPVLAGVGGDGASAPTVARQGDRLAFLLKHVDTNIWRTAGPAAKKSGPTTRIVASTREDSDQSFSPDGKKIAFRSTRSGSSEIWLSDSDDGSTPVQLTSIGQGTGTPGWSPDGNQIAFDCRQEGHSDIFVVSVQGGSPHRLTAGPSDNIMPSWSRDGKWIYFSSDRGGIWAVWKVAPEGGSAVQVTPQGERGTLDGSFVYGWSESVDRKFLYYVQNDSLWRVDATGGEAFRVLAFGPMRWRLFRNGICFMDESTRPAQLKLLDLSSRKTTRFGTVDLGPPTDNTGLGFDVSPDGQWVLYTRVDGLGSDLMVVENFR